MQRCLKSLGPQDVEEPMLETMRQSLLQNIDAAKKKIVDAKPLEVRIRNTTACRDRKAGRIAQIDKTMADLVKERDTLTRTVAFSTNLLEELNREQSMGVSSPVEVPQAFAAVLQVLSTLQLPPEAVAAISAIAQSTLPQDGYENPYGVQTEILVDDMIGCNDSFDLVVDPSGHEQQLLLLAQRHDLQAAPSTAAPSTPVRQVRSTPSPKPKQGQGMGVKNPHFVKSKPKLHDKGTEILDSDDEALQAELFQAAVPQMSTD